MTSSPSTAPRLVLNDSQLLDLLNEDAPYGDLTTSRLAIAGQSARLEFRARTTMRVCALEEAQRLFILCGTSATLTHHSGDCCAADSLLLSATGDAARLLLVWKIAQNLVEWSSGIASATAALVEAADGKPVMCTRKNVPGCKPLSVKAVHAGGAGMHRLGLSESLLLFPEHRLFLSEVPLQTISRLHRSEPEKKIVVEVKDAETALIWACAGADLLQLEKFSPTAFAACRQQLLQHACTTLLAATGGVRHDNIAAYVAAGADLLVTSAPYTAPPQDVAVSFHRLD